MLKLVHTKTVILLWTTILFNTVHGADFAWAVIGAGPAGITSVAVLLEKNVPPQSIVWIDPEFNAGRIGKYYGTVPSNQPA